jgi:hypothetical protein
MSNVYEVFDDNVSKPMVHEVLEDEGGYDPIDALLNDNNLRPETFEEPMPRLKTTFVLRSITTDEWKNIQVRASKEVSYQGQLQRRMDGDLANALTISTACINPVFQDKRFLEKFATPHNAVEKTLRPGEIIHLADLILQHSGFMGDVREEGVAIRKVKNS